jgi:PKD repeat protein
VHGQPFALIQQQIDQLWEAINNKCNGQSTPLLPTAVAHAFPDRATVGVGVSFTASGSFHPDPASGEPLTYDWDFGDGTTSMAESTSHAYGDPGTYVAVLRVTSQTGFVDSDTVVVRIADPLSSVGVGGVPSSGESPLIVSFYANVTGGFPPYSYLWDFGDGSTSSIPSPTHTYFAATTFFVALVVTDASGEVITPPGILITVTPMMPPEPPTP